MINSEKMKVIAETIATLRKKGLLKEGINQYGKEDIYSNEDEEEMEFLTDEQWRKASTTAKDRFIESGHILNDNKFNFCSNKQKFEYIKKCEEVGAELTPKQEKWYNTY